MDLETDKAHKKNWSISFHRYFPQEVCHINDKNTTCNFIGVFICSSVYRSVNITYHQRNIIYNSIEELAVVVTFEIIPFQLFGIYRRTWSVNNPVCKFSGPITSIQFECLGPIVSIKRSKHYESSASFYRANRAILPPTTNLDQDPDGSKDCPRISHSSGCYMYPGKK